MAIYDSADLTDGLVHVLDCGTWAEARLVSWAGSGVNAIQMGGFTYPVAAGEVQRLSCSVETEFQAVCGADECYASITQINLPVSQFLMGGAGLVCALLVAWAFIKSL